MKIKVEKVNRQDDKASVFFSTEYGTAHAIWNGDTPERDNEYFVELEIEETLTWGINLIRSENENFAIGMEEDKYCIIGYLESTEEDGYSVLRLGESIISLMVEGTPLTDVFVRAMPREVKVYTVSF